MKKLLTALLSLTMIFSLISVSATALNEDDYTNQDVFSIDEENNVLSPGVDYYFDCEWQNGPITDDFFEFYTVSVSVSQADEDNVSSTTARKIVEQAEFVKLNDADKYYFHFRAKANYSYGDDAEVHITVLAKDNSRDKNREDSRSWYEMDLEIGYYDKEVAEEVSTSQYDVDSDAPIIEFDEDLSTCRLDFEDGSYYNVRLSKVRKFNLGYTTVENTAITRAYPNATFKFISFYANPSFAYDSVLKVKAPKTTKYLYEIGDNNSLTLVSSVNNDGYFGYTTSRLGSYVASSIALDASQIALDDGSFENSNENVSSTPSATEKTDAASDDSTAASGNTAPALVNPTTGAVA